MKKLLSAALAALILLQSPLAALAQNRDHRGPGQGHPPGGGFPRGGGQDRGRGQQPAPAPKPSFPDRGRVPDRGRDHDEDRGRDQDRGKQPNPNPNPGFPRTPDRGRDHDQDRGKQPNPNPNPGFPRTPDRGHDRDQDRGKQPNPNPNPGELPRQPQRPVRKPPVFHRPDSGQQPGQPQQPGQQPGADRGRRVLPGRPDIIREREKLMDGDKGRSVIRQPDRWQDGRLIDHKPWRRAPTVEHTTIINNTTVINNILVHNHNETRRNYYYWHEYDGHRYCHYYDDWGYHWYGWYIGSSYFWSRYYYDRWWWYDPYWHRWCYWRSGYWWWQDPASVEVVYIYVDNSYYRYDDSRGGAVLRPDPTPPAEQPPADETPAPADPKQSVYYSNDGTRLVKIFGDEADAFLYDSADPPGFDPKYLGTGVTEVQFSDVEDGQPLQILVVMEKEAAGPDGTKVKKKSFKLFDSEGKPYGIMQQEIEGTPDVKPEESLKNSPAFESLSAEKQGW